VDLTIVHGNIAMTLIALDDISGAREAARAALNHAIALRNEGYVSDVIVHLACVAARSDRMDDAARLFGFCRHHYALAGLPHKIVDFTPAKWLTKWLAERFEADEIERLMSEGAAWPESRAIAVAVEL